MFKNCLNWLEVVDTIKCCAINSFFLVFKTSSRAADIIKYIFKKKNKLNAPCQNLNLIPLNIL